MSVVERKQLRDFLRYKGAVRIVIHRDGTVTATGLTNWSWTGPAVAIQDAVRRWAREQRA
jgi:hypothetical protein